MPRIRNMGTATMKFGEGIVVSGSAANKNNTSSDFTLIVSGSSLLEDDLRLRDTFGKLYFGQTNNDIYLRTTDGDTLGINAPATAWSIGDSSGNTKDSDQIRINKGGQEIFKIGKDGFEWNRVGLIVGTTGSFNVNGLSKFKKGLVATGSAGEMSSADSEYAAFHSSGSIMLSSESDTTGMDIEIQTKRPRLVLKSHAGSSYNSAVVFDKFNDSGDGSISAVASGMTLSQIDANGFDGSALRNATSIKSVVDGTPGSGDMPGRLEFRTSPDGSASVVTRMTIKNDGKVGIGTTDPDYELDVAGDIGLAEYIYHRGDDNTYIRFQDDDINLQAGGRSMIKISEGSIDQVLIMSGGSAASPNVKTSTDTNFFVSGSIDSIDSSTQGTSVFGGDVVISGSTKIKDVLRISEYITHETDTNTYIRFNGGDTIQMYAGGIDFIQLREHSEDLLMLNPSSREMDLHFFHDDTSNNARVFLLSEGASSTPTNATDLSFFVSGSIGSRGGSAKGTAVFDGDVVISGSLYTKQRHVNSAKFSSTDNSQRYVRWDAAGSNGSPGVNNKFIAPTDGRLLFVTVRCTSAANGTNVAFHKASDGTANLNTTAIETVGVDIDSSNTSFQVQFTSISNFSAGDILGISINPTSTPNDVNITCVWELDFVS